MSTQSAIQSVFVSPSGGRVRASTGRIYTLKLRRPRVDILQIEDVSFGLDREVLLPVAPRAFQEDPGPAEPHGPLAGLDAVRAALEFARFHPQKQLLVAGHTDSSGSDAHNLALSERRAQSVHLYLRGDRDGWAQQAADNDEIADLQTVLKWAALALGWPTDPGVVDGDWGGKTKAARRAFRQIANPTFGLDLDLDAKTSAADWGAIFDTYDLVLRQALKVDPAGLADLRAGLTFVEPGLLGCGEHWPASGLELDDQVNPVDRRVEFLWFDADEVVDLGGDLPGELIYGTGRYVFEPVPAQPSDPTRALHYQVRCVLLDHFHVAPLPSKPYRLRGPLPSVDYDRLGTTDASGRLQEDELPAGDYFLQVDDVGIVVGTHFTAADDPDDIYRLPLFAADHLPDSPRPYDDPWLLIDEDDDDDFADVGVDPYEPDEPELDVDLVLLEDEDPQPLDDEAQDSSAAA